MRFERPFIVWLLIGMVGIAVLALTIDLTFLAAIPDAPDLPAPLLRLLVVVQPSFIMAAGIAAGVGLSGKVGLWSWVTSRVRGEAARFPSPTGPVLVGLAGGVAIVLADRAFFQWYDPSAPQQAGLPGVGQAVSALLYGGIVEELMLRYGLLTLVFWGVWKLSGQVPGRVLGLVLIVVVAVVFGLGHLPAMAAVMPLDLPVILRTVALNASLGIVFGWFYTRKGLEAGMMAHAASHPGMWLGALLFMG